MPFGGLINFGLGVTEFGAKKCVFGTLPFTGEPFDIFDSFLNTRSVKVY